MDSLQLKRALGASSPDIRLQALEQLIQLPPDAAVLRILEEWLPQETNEECRLFVLLIISAFPATPSAAEGSPGGADIGRSWVAQYRSAVRSERFGLIRALSPRSAGVTVLDALTLIREESFPPLAGALLKKFGPAIAMADPPALWKLLETGLFSVRLAALETLQQTSPAALVEALPGYLSSPDLALRCLAVQGLFAIDPEEACRHLEHHLLGPDLRARDLMIQVCFQVPFEKLKGSLLKALRLESDPQRKEHLWMLVQHNPDPEVPFQLWLMVEETTDAEAAFYRKLLLETIKVIDVSGILGERFDDYRKNLQSWVNDRAARTLCQRMLSQWTASGSRDEVALLMLARQVRENSKIRKAFARECQEHWPADLREWYDRQAETKTAPTKPLEGIGEFPKMTREQQIELLVTWPQERAPELKPLLEDVIAGALSVGPEVQAAAIRVASRFRLPGHLKSCKCFLSSSSSPLIAAVLDYLAVFDPDTLVAHLGLFLRSSSARLKIQAIGLLRQFDLPAMVEYVENLLNQRDVRQQELGLECLFHVEFSVVRDLLAAYLKRCENDRLFRLGLALFQSNPDPGNPALLLVLEESLTPKPRRRGEVEKVRLNCQEFLIGSGLWNPADQKALEAAAAAQAKNRMDRAQRPKPAYALKARSPEVTWKDWFTDRVEVIRDWLKTPRT